MQVQSLLVKELWLSVHNLCLKGHSSDLEMCRVHNMHAMFRSALLVILTVYLCQIDSCILQGGQMRCWSVITPRATQPLKEWNEGIEMQLKTCHVSSLKDQGHQNGAWESWQNFAFWINECFHWSQYLKKNLFLSNFKTKTKSLNLVLTSWEIM